MVHFKRDFHIVILKMIEKNYKGKVKDVHLIDEESVRIVFHDQITAGDGDKKDLLKGKGKLNLDLTYKLFMILDKAGIPQHILKRDSDNSIIAKNLSILPVEIVVRNIVAGSFARRYGLTEGENLKTPYVEFFLKDDKLHDPLIDSNIAIKHNLITSRQRDLMVTYALQVNKIVSEYFKLAGMLLVDFKLEFGVDKNGVLFLGDELSADSMRVWDIETREKLDKDRFRKDLGDVLQGYKSILDRLEKHDFEADRLNLIVKVLITPKKGVNNPAGDVIHRTLNNLGVPSIKKVNTGKIISILIDNPSTFDWIEKIDNAAIQILTNPLIEQYEIKFSFD